MNVQLTEHDRARIIAAIRAAEARTSGEIYCVIAQASGSYLLVPMAWAALIALALPFPLIYFTLWPASVIYLLQLLLFLAAVFALSSARVRLLIVPRRAKRDRAHAEAIRQFLARGLHQTESRTGVLIFVSVAERYAELVADAGIDQKVPPGAWDEAVKVLIAGIKQNRPADGFIAAIEKCTEILALHFPPGATNRDELPNHVIEL
jgi:putative membrane protein